MEQKMLNLSQPNCDTPYLPGTVALYSYIKFAKQETRDFANYVLETFKILDANLSLLYLLSIQHLDVFTYCPLYMLLIHLLTKIYINTSSKQGFEIILIKHTNHTYICI